MNTLYYQVSGAVTAFMLGLRIKNIFLFNSIDQTTRRNNDGSAPSMSIFDMIY